MTTKNQIGTALRGVRTARGLSLHDVASDAGISVATLSRIETDKQNVDVPLLITLAAILRVTPAALLDGDGEMLPPVDAASLAHDLASLSISQRAKVVAAAHKQPRNAAARLDSLIEVLDVIGDELRALQRDLKKRPAAGKPRQRRET